MKIVLLFVATCAALFALLCLMVCVCAKVRRKATPSDCLIVLGARVYPDGRLSHTLQYRCESGEAAWKEGIAGSIIVCGGRGGDEPCTESAAMKAFLMKRGIPEACILEEGASRSTCENLENARKIMGRNRFERAAIVTSDYHVQRSLWIARRLGMDACAVAASSPRRKSHWIKSRIQESVSWILYFIRILLKR